MGTVREYGARLGYLIRVPSKESVMKVLLAAVLATASLLSSQHHTSGVTEGKGALVQHPRTEANRGVQSRIPHGSAIRVKSLPDCEDEGKTPCLTVDDVPGGWVIVKSYDPYATSKLIKECNRTKTNRPCVDGKHRNRHNEWTLYTK
jgi:hypothetical protein